ncbi:MAG: CHAD domain-containing protein [Burkholderiaceae bacterium]
MAAKNVALQHATEIELKLAVSADAIAKLPRLAPLARRTATQLRLNNIYFDTPDQKLRQQGIALRLRQDGKRWLQTLKTAGGIDGALTQRGEWESEVAGGKLDATVLAHTPWLEMDADGALFAALVPCFATTFDRTLWTVRRRDGSVVEVALDLGHITAGAASAPIAELELELKKGSAEALFALAHEFARHIVVLPASASKAQRGYALAAGVLDAPRMAQPPALQDDLPLTAAAQRVLTEMLAQFTENLIALREREAPELVHQARVGWRRFRSALKLFAPVLRDAPPPDTTALRGVLVPLGRWRDLDVATLETLPRIAHVYTGQNAARRAQWAALQDALVEARISARVAVRHALNTPAVGATLLALTQWVHGLPAHEHDAQLKRWAQQRVKRLRARMSEALAQPGDVELEHRARILAKRARYRIESLAAVLPHDKAKHWRKQATAAQSSIGADLDVVRAAELAAAFGVDESLVAFLNGVALGQRSRAAKP